MWIEDVDSQVLVCPRTGEVKVTDPGCMNKGFMNTGSTGERPSDKLRQQGLLMLRCWYGYGCQVGQG